MVTALHYQIVEQISKCTEKPDRDDPYFVLIQDITDTEELYKIAAMCVKRLEELEK
jgi:hypothetical protein